ncbi:MAG: PEP-CTERM system TPR-repeat protein PrsT, partial [Emcibacter sp.]|nr:PEP-CTERM system TPR-repeat protein PrsT [Emcibacter sp.]
PAKVIEKLEKEIQQGSKDALVYEVVGRAYIATRDRTNPTLFIKNMETAEEYIKEAYRLNANNTRVLITKAWLMAIMGKLDEAIIWLDKADSIIKDQRQNLIVKGELLVRQDKLDLAKENYNKLIKKFPQYPQYKVELGYIYLLNNEYTEAREWIEPVAKQYPNQIRPQYLLSNISLMEKKYEDAKQLSDLVLTKTPGDLNAIIVNGASSYFLGKFENAHQKLNHFYNRTGSIAALKLLVATKLRLNENTDAAKLLEDTGQTTENLTDTELLNLVAIASAKVGKVDAALEAFKKLAEQRPGTTSYKSSVGLIQISQGNYDEGFKNLEAALEEDKTFTEPGQKYYTLANKALQTRQHGRAAGYIEQYKKAAADNYRPWLMSAVLNNILKNNTAVRQDFEKAIEVAPKIAEVRARYAIFEDMQGNQDKALELAEIALSLDPSNFGSVKLIIADLIKKKDFDRIKDIVGTALKNDKINDISKLNFAAYYTFLGRPQETLNILEQLPNPIKGTASYKIISGKAYLRNGQAERAVAMLEDYSLKNPNNIQVLSYLLQGYLLTKNQTKYLTTLEKVDELVPNDFGNQLTLAKLYISMERYDQAKTTLNALKPENAQQKLQKAITLATMETTQGNTKNALAILSDLYKEFPKNGGISMLYSRNLASDGQVGKAIKVSKTWADQHSDNIDVKQFLGDLYMRNKDNSNASVQYEGILAAKDKATARIQLHAHNNLAMIYLENNQDQKAMEHAQKAIDMAPNNPAIVDTFAQVLIKQGQAAKAVDHFNQALALLPDSDRKNRSLFTLSKAKALIQDKQNKQAKRILTRLVRDDPKFSQIDEVKRILSGL